MGKYTSEDREDHRQSVGPHIHFRDNREFFLKLMDRTYWIDDLIDWGMPSDGNNGWIAWTELSGRKVANLSFHEDSYTFRNHFCEILNKLGEKGFLEHRFKDVSGKRRPVPLPRRIRNTESALPFWIDE